MTLVQMTKNLLVSIARPGPMNRSHQPGAGLAGCDRAWDDAERPVWISTALLRSALSSPHVS